MKKTRLFAVLLAVSLVVAAFCACLSVSAAKGDNLAKDKSYTGADPSKHPSNLKYNASLTDGVAAEKLSFDPGVWFAFYYNKDATTDGYINAPDGVGVLVIDLEDTYPVDTVKINTYLGDSSSSGILPPRSMKVAYSTDGEDFTALCDAKTFEKPEGGPSIDDVEKVEFKSASSVNARYIRVTVELAATFAFIDEVEVLEGDPVGGDGSADNSSDDSSAANSSAADSSATDTSSATSSATDSSAATSSTTESSTATSSTTESSAAASSTTSSTSSASAPAESASSPAATSSTGPTTGDAGLIGFAVLMVAAISGVAIAVKVRK